MGYEVDFDSLDTLYNQISTQVNTWQEKLTTLATSITALGETEAISGEGADAIRSYITSVHGTLVGLFQQLIALHVYNLLLYKQDYQTNIDTDLHAIIHESELTSIKNNLKTEQTNAINVDGEVSDALRRVSDIFYVNYGGVSDVDAAHSDIIQFLEELNQDIKDLENRHTSQDFAATEEMVSALSAWIQECAAQGRTYKTSFTELTLANSAAFVSVYNAYLQVSNEIDQKSSAISVAIENENERAELLQEEYEERQKTATAINWIVTGVCVIGSIVAIAATGGAATPLVVAGISAASSAVIAGTQNMTASYVENGDLNHLDLESLGKDVVVGAATGFVTGYLGASVSGAITSGLSNTALGSTLLNSSSTITRVGTGAVIGSVSQVGSGIISRGAGTLVSSGGDVEEALDAAFNVQNIVVDTVIGGVSGGIKGIKKPTTDATTQKNILKDGEQFNEDGTLKANVKYSTGEHEYIYETDENGLISHVEADNLEFKTHEGRLQHNSNTLGKEVGDDAGHLIGDRFGGSSDIDNLVSQDSHLNRSQYKIMENDWDKALSQNKKVTVSIDIEYPTGSARPSGFNVNYTIDGELFRQFFANFSN